MRWKNCWDDTSEGALLPENNFIMILSEVFLLRIIIFVRPGGEGCLCLYHSEYKQVKTNSLTYGRD